MHDVMQDMHIINHADMAVFIVHIPEIIQGVDRFSVPQVVIAAHDKAMPSEETGKIVVSLNMLRHTMRNLK